MVALIPAKAPQILTVSSQQAAEFPVLLGRLPVTSVIVCMPAIDRVAAQQTARILAQRAGFSDLRIVICLDDRRLGFIACANAVYQATQSKFFAYVAQDAFPGRAWLKQGLRALSMHRGGLLGFNDGKWQGSLAAFGLISREWADTLYGGALFCPAYRRHYADAELTVIALAEGRYVYDPHALLVEVDYRKDTSAVEAEDRACYRARVAAGFDGRYIPPHLQAYVG